MIQIKLWTGFKSVISLFNIYQIKSRFMSVRQQFFQLGLRLFAWSFEIELLNYCFLTTQLARSKFDLRNYLKLKV